MVNRRGQLLLTAAILVSLTIVASAVLLNDIHASADVNAQQERQGLEQTERNIEQLQDSLRELFMVNGSEERIPYVDDADKLANATEEYVKQYLNVSTQNSAQFVNVTLIDAEQNAGAAIWQNATDTFPDGPNQPIVGKSLESHVHVLHNHRHQREFLSRVGDEQSDYNRDNQQ
ncbi:DUF7261 family protein [Halovenus salina]|uniref:DUF7261 family protein n=1 Tax=Halovenus salina TaxID=1510225 RepID=UPI0036D3F761